MTDITDRASKREAEIREDGIAAIRAGLPQGGAARDDCRVCHHPIPPGRREALPGVQTCAPCQAEIDAAVDSFHR